MTDAFGDRMKLYESATRYVLPARTYTILRVDGRAFHTYLRNAVKPFDVDVIAAMDATAVQLCNDVSGTRFAYTQSDEISLLLSDLGPRTQPWFGGVVQKMASVSASIATAAFNQTYRRIADPINLPEHLATFDSRVYTMTSRIEVANYFLWRQQDAIRNAVSMAAQATFSHRELHGKNTAQMQEMLFQQHGINFKTFYSDRIRRGAVVTRQTHWANASVPVRKIGPATKGQVVMGERKPLRVQRRRWVSRGADDFTLDNGGFLAEHIPTEPDDALQPVRCAHEAWEESTSGRPSKCADCGHAFTDAEAAARGTAS